MTSTRSTLAGVVQQCPADFELTEQGTDFVCGRFRIDSSTSVSATTFLIRIKAIGNSLEVSEIMPGTQLPKACAERHINPDHTFCLGLDAGVNVATQRDIDEWWLLLERFLHVQLVAERTKRWPIHKMLSHGHAGVAHAEALAIAERLNIGMDYEAYLTGSNNWINNLIDDFRQRSVEFAEKSLPVTHLTESLIVQVEKEVKARELQGGMTRRKRRRLIRKFAAIEQRRAEQERAFWRKYEANETKCCGTMINCPLRKH